MTTTIGITGEEGDHSPSPSKWGKVRAAVKVAQIAKHRDVTQADTLAVSSTTSSASAAFARSLVLFTGFLFRRPSKLFRPSRVDTWAGLRQLAISSDQTLSPSFIRNLLKKRAGVVALTLTLLPPLMVNTTLGFLLFTSHTLFSIGLARLPSFQRPKDDDLDIGHYYESSQAAGSPTTDSFGREPADSQETEEDPINFETLLRGPSIIPKHPTILSAIAGAGAGLVQGAAFTPVENLVRFLQQSTSSITNIFLRVTHLPLPHVPSTFDASQPQTPLQAVKNLLSSDAWRKSPSWWTGWRWAVSRDALSYACFFAAFDVTRRIGLRVKAFFGGDIQTHWNNFLVIETTGHDANLNGSSSSGASSSDLNSKAGVPTIARVAQATTIVTGGVAASILAELAGRPFRACQKIMQLDKQARMAAASNLTRVYGSIPLSLPGAARPNRINPILQTLKAKGLHPFLHPDDPPQSSTKPIENALTRDGRVVRMVKRVGWRLAAVGPWGMGFLVWAWVGGEV